MNKVITMVSPSRKQLSKTEYKVIHLLEKGYSNKEISDELNISGNTVKYHLKNIYKKLKVKNRLEAVYKYKYKNRSND